MSERLLPAAALAVAVAACAAAAQSLGRSGVMPARATPYVLLFAAAFGLAFFAGRWASRRSAADAPRPAHEGTLGPCHAGHPLALTFALSALAATWALQSRMPPPGILIPVWLAAVAAMPFAFPSPGPARRNPAAAGLRRAGPILLVVGAALAAAAGARLARLSELPPVLSGDEVNQILDGKDWLSGPGRSDPFGTGWYGTIRLGMIPAGAGALAGHDPIAGPRLPYAVVGTLAVVASTVAAAQIAGPFGAAACAAFLAFAPHHVHFSRLASVMVPDSLLAAATVVFLLGMWRRGSPRLAAFAGAAAGLSLYGYAGGRVLPVVVVLTLFGLSFSRQWSLYRRRWLALALAAGFAAAAGPNMRFANAHFADWNSRFNQVSVFSPAWLADETRRLGSREKIAVNQLKAGTIGLLSATDETPWFTGHPMIGPPLLVGCAIAGAGWLLGRRRRLELYLVGLLVAGNLAGVVLTVGSPAPQRVSSLVPALAILAGAAVAGMVSLLPAAPGRAIGWQLVAGTLAAGVILGTGIRDYPFHVGQFARYGGHHAGLAQSAAKLLAQPRFRNEPVHLHGVPFVHSSFPSFGYFLPFTRFSDDDAADVLTEASFEPGFHLFTAERIAEGETWRRRLGLAHGIRIAHPSNPLADVGYAFVVPRTRAAARP